MHPKANEGLRNQFREQVQALESSGKCIVYIDESGFSQDMPRTHGYAKKGQRCYGKHDWQAKGRINVIGAFANKKMLAWAQAKSI